MWSVNHLRYWCHHYQPYSLAVANHLEPPPPPRNLIVAVAADDTAQGRHASTFSRPEFFSKISRRTDFVGFFERFPSDPVGAFSLLFVRSHTDIFQCLVACKDYRIKVAYQELRSTSSQPAVDGFKTISSQQIMEV